MILTHSSFHKKKQMKEMQDIGEINNKFNLSDRIPTMSQY
jgi:hypothetical protein